MKKLLMASKKGNYEINLLEREADNAKIKQLLNNKCPECNGKTKMRGHIEDGMYELHKCKKCETSFGLPALKVINGVPN
jgi:ribosomal protein L37AE/L43A